MAKTLAFDVFVTPSDDPDNPAAGRWFRAGDEVPSEFADRVGDHAYAEEDEYDEEDGNGVLRQSNVPLKELKRIADELGVEYPARVGADALAQAIRYAQGRQNKSDPPGSHPDARNEVVFETSSGSKPATKSSRKAADTNDAAGS